MNQIDELEDMITALGPLSWAKTSPITAKLIAMRAHVWNIVLDIDDSHIAAGTKVTA
jgi:hypothetical protein